MVKQVKRIFRTLNVAKVFCAVLGVFMLTQVGGDAFTLLKPARSFEDILAGGVSAGAHVRGEVPYLLDYFSTEESWKENSNGSVTPRKTSSYYYLLPGGNVMLGLKLKAEHRETAQALVEDTYAYLLGAGEAPVSGLSFEGKAVPMETEYPELEQAFEETLTDGYGYTAQEVADMGTPLVLLPLSPSGVWGLFGTGAVMTLAAALWIMKDIRRANRRAREKAAAAAAEAAAAPVSAPAQGPEKMPWEE